MRRQVRRLVESRAGLWVFLAGLILAPSLLFVTAFGSASNFSETLDVVSAASSASIGSTEQPSPESVVSGWPEQPSLADWNQLPGLKSQAQRALSPGEQGMVVRIPVPTGSDTISTERLPGGSFRYTIEYADGGVYTATGFHSGGYQLEYTEGGGLVRKAVMAVLFGTIVLMLLVGLASVVFNLSGADPAARKLSSDVDLGPQGQGLLERWLKRSRFYRLLGGAVGGLLSFEVAGGDWHLGSGLLGSLSGVPVGGALAEVHLIRRRRSGQSAAANITARRISDYTHRRDHAVMAGLSLLAVAVIVSGLLGAVPADSIWFGAMTIVLFAFVLRVQQLVVTRSRPALGAELKRADDLLRYLAATQGFTRPAVAVGFLAMASALGYSEAPALLRVVAPGLFVAALVWLFIGRQSKMPKAAARFLATT